MIEAVNSVLVSAPAAQKAVAQSSTKSVSSEPAKVQPASSGSEELYFSRNVRVDNNSKVAVLEFRNPLNGDVKTQIPTEAQLKAYEAAEARESTV